MLVPKTPMHKDDFPKTCKHDVWFPRKFFAMKPKSKTHSMNGAGRTNAFSKFLQHGIDFCLGKDLAIRIKFRQSTGKRLHQSRHSRPKFGKFVPKAFNLFKITREH